jgi:phospholipase C
VYGRSILTYFGTPLFVNGIQDLSKISNQITSKEGQYLVSQTTKATIKSKAKLPAGLKDL